MVMVQKDYLLRQIELVSKAICKMLGLEVEYHPLLGIVDEKGELAADGNLRYQLSLLLGEGRINEAEDLLFEHLEEHLNSEYIGVALDFYGTLAEMSEYELGLRDFSRQEVLDGLEEVKRMAERIDNEAD